MDRGYRVMLAGVALVTILCTLAAGYAGIRILGVGKQLLSNEALLGEIERWWTQSIQ